MTKYRYILILAGLAVFVMSLPAVSQAQDHDRSGVIEEWSLWDYFWSRITLENNVADSPYVSDCSDPRSIGPTASEDSHLLAVSFQHSRRFALESISYELLTEQRTGPSIDCSAAVPHQVHIWVGDAEFPVASPVWIESHTVHLPGAIEPGIEEVTVELDDWLYLDESEVLFVAVEMNIENQEALCLLHCASMDITANTNFWSNDDSAPYPWNALEDFGMGFGDIRVFSHGMEWKPLNPIDPPEVDPIPVPFNF